MHKVNMNEPITHEELSTLSLVRCKTCNKTIGHLYDRFVRQRDLEALSTQVSSITNNRGEEMFPPYDPAFTTPSEVAFFKLGIKNECCRYNITNPPKIAIGGYFFNPDNVAPNTYIMGEYGKNFGNPEILDELNNTMTEEGKRPLLNMGIAPVYKKTVSTSNQRYGSRFQPTLQEQYSSAIKGYVNLNSKEMQSCKKGLWHLFLYSMYARGWKGPGFSYPITSTGMPDLGSLLERLRLLADSVTNDLPIKDYPSLQGLKRDLILFYAYIGNRHALYNRDQLYAMLDNVYNHKVERTNDVIPIISQLIDLVEQGAKLLFPQDEFTNPNIEKMNDEYQAFERNIKYTDAVYRIYSTSNSINVISGNITKQTTSLPFRVRQVNDNVDIYDNARIVAITCYYLLSFMSDAKIANFFPLDITSSLSGTSIIQTPVTFVIYIE